MILKGCEVPCGEKFTIAGLSDVEAIEKISHEERVPEKSTLELLEKGAAVNPEAPAITFLMSGEAYDKPQIFTHAQLIGRIRQTANMLSDLGVRAEDVVTYLLPNLPQTHFVLWGAEAAGIANPINPMLEAATIRDICNAAGTKILVALGEIPGTDIWQKVESIRNEIPTLKAVVRVLGPSDESQAIYGYDEVIDRYPADRLTFDRDIHPDDIASLYHTGGTTGRPKLARRTHNNEVVLTWILTVGLDLEPGDTVMCGLPLFHCNGSCITGLTPFASGGNTVLLSPAGYRDPGIIKNFWKIVEKYKPKMYSCVPTVLGVLLDVPTAGADVSSLEHAIVGAAPLSVELFNRFEKHSGLKLLEGYGMTETTCASATNPRDGERKVGSIGVRLPYHWLKVVVVDEEGRYVRDAETDEIGVLAASGPCIFKGYVEDIHNKGIWLDDKKEWFNTGDLARQDADGYLWLTGRRKDLIIRGGHNIDPALIEEALYKMPQIKTAAAVGRPDAHAGEVPVVFVEVAEGSNVTSDGIMDFAKSQIGERAAVPKKVEIVEQMPLTAVGKIFKPALRWLAIKQTYEDELAALGDSADSIDVEVGEDKVHGVKAVIRVKAASGVNSEDIRSKVADILSRYTIHYDVDVVQ